MKIQELRIGNIVGVNIFERHFGSCLLQCRITGVIHDETESSVRIGYYDAGSSRHYYRIIAPYEVMPIPLTEELLLRCGFKDAIAEEGERFLALTLPYGVENDVVVTSFTDDRSAYLSLAEWSVDDTIRSENTMCFFPDKPIFYLHQLQNLYFALTGEERKVNM